MVYTKPDFVKVDILKDQTFKSACSPASKVNNIDYQSTTPTCTKTIFTESMGASCYFYLNQYAS